MSSKTKYRIAMLIDAWFPFYGGGQVHVDNLTRHLGKRPRLTIELFYAGRSYILVRLFWSIIAILQVLYYHQKKSFDLIHSHGYIAGLPAKVLSLLLKIPVVHTVHGSSLIDQNKKTPKAWLERILLTKISYDAQITVSSNFLMHENVNQNISIIPNGVDVSKFNKIKTRKNSKPSIIWVGRDDRVKGIKYLKAAIVKVRKKFPSLHAELVTGGRLVGEALIKAYKQSHVFVLSSLAEGQPLTLLEAWAAKLPVVVTNVGDNPQMVKDGINGYLVESENTQQLANSIIKVLKNKSRAKKMGLSGYRLVKSKYSWEAVAKQTYQVYRKLIKSNKKND